VLPFFMAPPFAGRAGGRDGGGRPSGDYATGSETPRIAHSSSRFHAKRLAQLAERTLKSA